MGRRPNQRVLEYFDRGARLEDHSNRYEHTCRACGQPFPKGRIETLIAHIERRCPSITRHNGVPEPSPVAIPASPTIHANRYHQDALKNPNDFAPEGKQLVLPVSSRRSGLEALVEAANRQLEPPRKAPRDRLSRHQSIDSHLEKADALSRFQSAHQDSGEAVHDKTAYSTSGRDGSHAMSSGLMENICPHSVDPFTRVKRSQDPAMLSMIAASAANLQVTMPHDIGNERDQARTAIAQDAMSQQSMETMTHSEDLDSAKSVDESTERQRFKPVPGPLIEPFPAESGLEVGSCHETCGLEKPLGRAQKVRGLRYANGGDSGASPMPFTIRLCTQQTVDSAEHWEIGENAKVRSATLLNDSTDQIAAKLLPHMQATISHPSYEEADPLIERTLRLVSNSIQEKSDILLAQTFDLWALTQVLVSSPHHWHLVPDPLRTEADEQRQDPSEIESPGFLRSHSPTLIEPVISQLRAAAQERASTTSKTILIDLERRLERKERCQGFETFLVGVLFLNCVERMCWTVRKASVVAPHNSSKDREPRDEKPMDDYYLDQAARFAAFLSKLYKMRGILVHVRQQGPRDDDDGILHATSPTVAAPAAERWLGDLRLTSESLRAGSDCESVWLTFFCAYAEKMIEERRNAGFDADSYRCFDFRFCSLLLLVEE
ncbi:MAG: hypothetical protein LQ348_005866 [Seirophora lacunosa]|nr:MAG: hypothetical protein LQ348_005866 [Seirophora lacunosa]